MTAQLSDGTGSKPEVSSGAKPASARAQPSATGNAGPAREDSNRPLHALRLLFSLWLVVFHGDHAYVFPRPISAMGYVGTVFFLMLSGFVLALAYLGSGKPLQAKAFWWSRFTRLYPVYLLSGLLVLPFDLMHYHGRHGALVVCEHLGLYATMTQSWTLGLSMSVLNMPGWTVSSMAFFFLVFPFLGPRLTRLSTRTLYWILGGSVIASLLPPLLATWWMAQHGVLILANDSLAVFSASPPDKAICDTLHTFPLIRLPEFLDGMILALLWQRGAAPVFLIRHGLFLGALTMAFLVLISPNFPYLIMHNAMFIPPCACFILWAVGFTPARWHGILNRPWWDYLGKITFTIYLLHGPVLRYAILCNIEWTWISEAVVMMVILAAACLTNRYVEEPARTYLRRIDPAAVVNGIVAKIPRLRRQAPVD